MPFGSCGLPQERSPKPAERVNPKQVSVWCLPRALAKTWVMQELAAMTQCWSET